MTFVLLFRNVDPEHCSSLASERCHLRKTGWIIDKVEGGNERGQVEKEERDILQ